MSTTEGGRKVTAAVASTGRAVATTSRAVGGALSQARGALTGWWSALTAPPASGISDTSSIGNFTSIIMFSLIFMSTNFVLMSKNVCLYRRR